MRNFMVAVFGAALMLVPSIATAQLDQILRPMTSGAVPIAAVATLRAAATMTVGTLMESGIPDGAPDLPRRRVTGASGPTGIVMSAAASGASTAIIRGPTPIRCVVA